MPPGWEQMGEEEGVCKQQPHGGGAATCSRSPGPCRDPGTSLHSTAGTVPGAEELGARAGRLHTHPRLVRDVLRSCAPAPHRQGNCTLELQSNRLAQQLNERETERKAAR